MHVGPKDGSLWYTMLYRTVPTSGPGEVRRFRYIGPTTGVDDPAGSGGGSPSPARFRRPRAAIAPSTSRGASRRRRR